MRIQDVKPVSFTHMIRCDKCGSEKKDGGLGFEEFASIEHHCGYTTVEDDGNHIELDLCYPCFKELLGPYWRMRSNWIDNLQAKQDNAELPGDFVDRPLV